MNAPVDVLGVGECSVDEVVRVEALPPPGGKARARSRQRLAGGQVATASLACARLGLRTAFVSSVGDDADGVFALAPLAAAGVDVTRVRRVPGAPTRRAWICVEERSGERTIVWQRDERLALALDAVSADDVASACAVLVDPTDLGLALRVADFARRGGVPCVLDADSPAPGIDELLAAASHPVISAPLAKALFGSPEAAVRALARAGAVLPVVTQGAEDAVAWIGGRVESVPAFAIEAVDCTGAGDAFHAGLVYGMLTGFVGAALLRVAHAVAACACLAPGAQGGLPDRDALEAFLRERPNEATPPRSR